MSSFIPEIEDEQDNSFRQRPRYGPVELISKRFYGLKKDDGPLFFESYFNGPSPYDDFYDDKDYDYDDEVRPDFEMRKKRMQMKRKRHIMKRKVKRS